MKKNSHYIIIGLGQTGISCVRYLQKQKIPFSVMDTRLSPPGLTECRQIAPDIEYHLGKLDPLILEKADTLIVSPGIATSDPAIAQARAKGVAVIGDIELFARVATAPIIGITGTNAKGTVTTMLGEMAKLAGKNVIVGGNIGIPILDLLDQNADLYVLELSSFQLETTYSLHTEAATILNISPDHLDRYTDLTDYANAKKRIFNHCRIKVINADDKMAQPNDENWPHEPHITFTSKKPNHYMFGLQERNHEIWLTQGSDFLIPVSALKIKGQHNYMNALAALALGYAIKIPTSIMLNALIEFPGLDHRCQWIADHHQVSWYNDSKATNLGATIAALQGLAHEKNIVLIAGGDAKGTDLTPLQPYFSRYVKQLILLGKDAPIIAAIAKDCSPIHFAESIEAAAQLALECSAAGDIVLLAPACSSLDMFSNYGERGDRFVAAVKALIDES